MIIYEVGEMDDDSSETIGMYSTLRKALAVFNKLPLDGQHTLYTHSYVRIHLVDAEDSYEDSYEDRSRITYKNQYVKQVTLKPIIIDGNKVEELVKNDE